MLQRLVMIACVSLVWACSRGESGRARDAAADVAETGSNEGADAGLEAETAQPTAPSQEVVAPNPVEVACAAFAAGRVKDARLLQTKAYLCGKDTGAACTKRTNRDCTQSPMCFAVMGGSSCKPPNTSNRPCTPDMVFHSCLPAPRELLARQVADYLDCMGLGGPWRSLADQPRYENHGLIQLGACGAPR